MRTMIWLALAVALLGAPGARPGETAVDAEETQDDLGLGRLLHAGPSAVRERLGAPDVERAEGKGAFWTYRLPHCALFVFFHDGAKGLRVAGASTGPRRRGEPVLSVAACIASAAHSPDT